MDALIMIAAAFFYIWLFNVFVFGAVGGFCLVYFMGRFVYWGISSGYRPPRRRW